MDLAKQHGWMGKGMKGNMWMIKSKEKVFSIGKMGEYMWDIGARENRMGWEYKYHRMVISQWQNGRMGKKQKA